MRKLICLAFVACTVTVMAQQYKTYPAQMERLDRGVVALPAAQKGVFVSWRLLGTDKKGATFDLMRDGIEIAKGLTVTNYTDAETPYTRVIEHKHFRKRPTRRCRGPTCTGAFRSTVRKEAWLVAVLINIRLTTARWAMWMATGVTNCS